VRSEDDKVRAVAYELEATAVNKVRRILVPESRVQFKGGTDLTLGRCLVTPSPTDSGDKGRRSH